jgi:uncharacterized membrane protein YidH (DUF202 family)
VICVNEKGRKRVVISIVLIVVGALVSSLAWEDYLTNHQVLYDSAYVMYPEEAISFFVGILVLIIGFGLLAYIYIKIDKYKNHS